MPLYVIGVGEETGDGVSASHLKDMACAGAGFDAGCDESLAKPYRAVDREGLVSAFQQIIFGLRSCILDLHQKIANAELGTVTIGCDVVPYRDPNGWLMNGDDRIELVGDACKRIQTGYPEIQVVFPCRAVVR
jgi:hypothetical protein